MKKVEILGTGCHKCKQLFERTRKVIDDNGLDCELVKIEDIQQIVAKGVMMTPGFVVDGEVKTSGKLLSPEQIKELIV